MKSKVILGTVAECTPSPPAHPTRQVSGINHHHKPALGCPMSGPSVTSPSALSGAVHSLQHQGPVSALPQPFSSSSIAPFHHQFKFSALLGGYSKRKDGGDSASRAKEVSLPHICPEGQGQGQQGWTEEAKGQDGGKKGL